MLLALALPVGSAYGASVQIGVDGNIIDPIMNVDGGVHSYTGANLEPNAELPGANLSGAMLHGAFLINAILREAFLHGAFLINANLTDADLARAWLNSTNLTDANLTGRTALSVIGADLHRATLVGANLTGAWLTDTNLTDATFGFGTILPDGQTVAQHGFDAAGLQVYLEAGFDNVWVADNLTIIPEPTTLLLALLAMITVPHRVRRG